MATEKQIKVAIAQGSTSQRKLAESIGMTPANFNQKLKRCTFTDEELEKIAKALGATYHCYFEFEDGTKI
ncbi:helix-turn-helix domain-containing protein [Thomasclavelia cocleata]|uniref:helix-turn-helix domain-containing protein n=1 Tax=Thomasclavelia cocleata TaxID=69824 RepID=UPI0024954517|nr:helix-turn-helix domain-containing protein [Thomasclavelia cocleata]